MDHSFRVAIAHYIANLSHETSRVKKEKVMFKSSKFYSLSNGICVSIMSLCLPN